MLPHLKNSEIHPDIEGSDHCPVSLDLDLDLQENDNDHDKKIPSCCIKSMLGKQKKVSQFFTKVTNKEDLNLKRPNEFNDSERPKKVIKQAKLSNFFTVKTKSEEKLPDTSKNFETKPIETKSFSTNSTKNEASASAWKTLFGSAPEAPLCKGHKEKAVLKTVGKKGPNKGRQFWSCPRGTGKVGDPEACCDFFRWVKPAK